MTWRRMMPLRADAERLGGLDVFLPLDRQGLAADDARHVEPLDRADGDEHQHEVPAEEHHQHDDEEDEGQGVQDVDDAHHDLVDAPAEIAGRRAVEHADRRRDEGRRAGRWPARRARPSGCGSGGRGRWCRCRRGNACASMRHVDHEAPALVGCRRRPARRRTGRSGRNRRAALVDRAGLVLISVEPDDRRRRRRSRRPWRARATRCARPAASIWSACG